MTETVLIYERDALFMVDLGAWQMWQHLEFQRMLAAGYDGEPPNDGGTPISITALWRRFFFANTQIVIGLLLHA